MRARWLVLLLVPRLVCAATIQIGPSDSLMQAISQLRPGDTLELRGGTYTQAIRNALGTIPSGTADAPIIIRAALGEAVWLKPGSGTAIDLNYGSGGNLAYVTFDGLNIDAQKSGDGIFINGGGVSHLRIQNAEVMNARTQGISGYTASYITYSNLNVHDNGTDGQFDHGFYLAQPYSVIENSKVHDNANYGIQLYESGTPGAATGMIVRNTAIYNNKNGVTLDYGDNIQFVNNDVFNNAQNGVDVFYAVTNAKVLDNTIRGNGGHGIELSSGSADAVLHGNMVQGNGAQAILDGGNRTNMTDAYGAGATPGGGATPPSMAGPVLPPSPTNVLILIGPKGTLQLGWSFPRSGTIEGFRLTAINLATGAQDALDVAVSAPGACGTDTPERFCAQWPACPAPGVYGIVVQAKMGGQLSGETQAFQAGIGCQFLPNAPCQCQPLLTTANTGTPGSADIQALIDQATALAQDTTPPMPTPTVPELPQIQWPQVATPT